MAGGSEARGGECCYYTTDDALSQVGFGRFQALVLAYAGVGWTAEAMEIMMLSFVGPSVKDEWGISGQQEGLITSVVFAGMIIGGCLGGVISDSYGRRYIVNSQLSFVSQSHKFPEILFCGINQIRITYPPECKLQPVVIKTGRLLQICRLICTSRNPPR